MKPIFNQSSLLWIIGILQPVSPGELQQYLSLSNQAVGFVPTIDAIRSFCLEYTNSKHLIRVSRDPELFSLTSQGNSYLTKKHRYARDIERIFLLKKARKNKLDKSREGSATRLDGVSPSLDTRSTLQGCEANKLGFVVPRSQAYWPRPSKQLLNQTGLLQPSRDNDELQMLSFSDAAQLAIALDRKPAQRVELDGESLGLMLGISPRLIMQIAKKPSNYYRSFRLKKRGGGYRTIESPRVFLKVLQHFLVDYYSDKFLVHSSVQSYSVGRSIVTNAEKHCCKDYVSTIDIKNFFGSVTYSGVVKLLQRSGAAIGEAMLFASLTTKNGSLPQGAPSSPFISNAYLYDFDVEMEGFCIQYGLDYTRYADDISISGKSKKKIEIAIEHAKDFLEKRYNLECNEKKTRIASKGAQQVVTGVLVNNAPRPTRVARRRIRAVFNKAQIGGLCDDKIYNRLRGYLSYLMSFKDLRDSNELRLYKEVLDNLVRTPQSKVPN